ncbi:MAG: mannonate dehydratase [Oceanipulchritudo sp.]
MKAAEYFRHDELELARLMRQLGVEAGVLRCPESADGTRTDEKTLRRLKQAFAGEGVSIQVIEPVPNDIHEPIKQGLPGRDAAIERLHDLIRTMGRLDISTLCYNFMARYGWTRNNTEYPARGGARVSSFDRSQLPPEPAEPDLTEEQLWENYRYFLRAVLPVAEEAGVTLALHPDDPPVSPLRGVGRIFTSIAAFDRALAMSGSPFHAVTFCQGTFRLMGQPLPDLIRHFGMRIAYVHVRDTKGVPERFHECFHDDGPTDMVEVFETYRKIGYDGYYRPDHVPTLEGESNERPGYARLGRLFAVGYLRGIQTGIEQRPKHLP